MSSRHEEWVASLLAGAGSVWFVEVLTKEAHRILQIIPPTGGPTEVIGLAVLIWLHAKHQRILASRNPIFSQLPQSSLEGALIAPDDQPAE